MYTKEQTCEILRAIDREMYILKNRIMLEFDTRFATNLRAYDADSLYFEDIFKAVEDQDGNSVYEALKKVAKHGVSSKHKTFLYEYIGTEVFHNEAGRDFDDYLGIIKAEVEDTYMATMMFKKAGIEIIHHYCSLPFWRVETVREMPKAPMQIEALLLQNGFAMIVHTVKSWEDLPREWTKEEDEYGYDDDNGDDDY